MESARRKRKERVGIVISNNTPKSVIVRIDRTAKHLAYRKVMRKSVEIMVHDEEGKAKAGDKVRIMSTRPLSKSKRWMVAEIMKN